jgi:RimJ/RimL family protein N-acetyltransferase
MYELDSQEFDRARPIFEGIQHDRAIIFAVIEGNTPGRIFVDHPQHPRVGLLRFSGGELYLAGPADDQALNREIGELILNDLAAPPHLLIFGLSEAWQGVLDDLLKEHGVMRVVREEFVLDPARFRAAHADWRTRVPAGFHVQQMDRDLALRSDPSHEILWGSIDNFYARAFGFCVLKGDEIVSRCSPVALGDRRFETGVNTQERYRQQGFATLACCAFIERCLEGGFLPEWGCYYNKASKALALKLGFRPAAGCDRALCETRRLMRR